MKAEKWVAVCACFAGSVFAAGAQFDVVIRDFSVSHPDFENYSEVYAEGYGDAILAYEMVGYDASWYSGGPYHLTCGSYSSKAGAKIGVDGKPMTVNANLPEYLQNASAGSALKYGECADGKSQGYSNGQDSPLEPIKTLSCAASGDWDVEVYYTPGMVQSYLSFDAPGNNGYDMLDGVHIQKLNESCDNGYFDQWYEDVDGVNFRINKTLDLPSVKGSNFYQVNYNYNNGGFAPLDSVGFDGKYEGALVCNPAAQRKGESNTPINTSCTQWGPQSLTIYCPPFAYPYASAQTDATGTNTRDLCTSWLANGGPKSPTAAVVVAPNHFPLGYKHLRNYNFTMMGYAKFKYKSDNQGNSGEVFEFVADDDMWVFVDGVMVEDRGGVHSTAPAPGAVNIKTLAMNNHGCHAGEPLAYYTNCEGASDETGWAENSWHHLHFFYAERQNNGASNLLIRSSIAELEPSKFDTPSIMQVVATVESNGQEEISITMNSALSAVTLQALAQQAADNENVKAGDKVDPATAKYGMLVKRQVFDENTQSHDFVVYGLLLKEVSEISVNVGEAVYEFRGVLVDESGNVVGNIRNGDGIAFNYTGIEGSDNMVYEYWNAHSIDIVSNSGKRVDLFPSEWPRVVLTVVAESSSSNQEQGSSSSQENSSSSSAETSSSHSNHNPDDDAGKTFVVGTPENSGGLSVALRGNTLQVHTAKTGLLKVQVLDMVGHVVESVSENVPAGNFAYTFGKMGKGAYIVRVQQGAMVRTIRK